MSKCCGRGTCACVIQAGPRVRLDGDGSMNNPFIVTSEVDLTVVDNTIFNLSITGSGTTTDPWALSVNWAVGSGLHSLLDVFTPTPSTGQVLGWTGTRWEAVAPTTAASGSVNHNTSLTGDGSGGTPLAVVADAARFLSTTSAGVGLSSAGSLALVRHFVDAAARTAATPAPVLNALTTLDTAPGRIDYYTGSAWAQAPGKINTNISGQMLAMSGTYGGSTATQMVRQIDTVTDPDGNFDVYSVADLTGLGGVISCVFQPIGSIGFAVSLNPDINRIVGTAYRLDTGTPYASQAITGVATGLVY